MTYTAKQRLTFLAIVIVVVISTHYLYQWMNPQWIAYRRAEVSYQNQEWNSAILYYRESLEKGAKNPYIYSRLGDTYSKTRDFPMAVKAYEKYLELKPNDLWAMRAYAGVLTANGEFDRAAQEYEKILKEEAKQK